MENLNYQIDFLFDKPKIDICINDSVLSYIFNHNDTESFYSDSDGIHLNNIMDGIDFVYKTYHSELKEEIVVHSRKALQNLSFKIKCENCSIIKDGNDYYVTNENDEKIWKFMPLYACDINGLETEDIEVHISECWPKSSPKHSNEYIIQIGVSAQWLENVSYPIVIDPTISRVYSSAISMIYADDIYAKLAVPIGSPTPVINDGVNAVNDVNVYISHEDLTDEIVDYQIRNWNADQTEAWSKWYPVNDSDPWQLLPINNSDNNPELKTIEVKYRLSTILEQSPQEVEVGEEITNTEKYRWLERYRNTIGGEVLSITTYGDDIYIGSKIPYGNSFRGSIWKFNGKYFEFIAYLEAVVNGHRVNVFPHFMKVLGGSIYIGAGRDDDTEGSGVVFRYNDTNGIILSSILGGAESKVTAINAYMDNIYVGTKENRVYRYNADTGWSLVFDLSFEDNYQGVSDIATLNGIYVSFYDEADSHIYFYDNEIFRKVYTLKNEHIYSMRTIPAIFNDKGIYNIYLQTADKIFKFEKEKINEDNAVFEQIQNAPNSPWLRSYIDLPGKTEGSFNQINSAAIPMPSESFLPTVVGKNGYIAAFNDKTTSQISNNVTTEDLNDIEIVRPSDYYIFRGSEIRIDSDNYIYFYNSELQTILKVDNTSGDILNTVYIDNEATSDIMFTIGEDCDIIYVNKTDKTLNVMDKNFRFKDNMAIEDIAGIFAGYNMYDGYVYLTSDANEIRVYDLKQKRLVRTIGSSGVGDGQFDNPRGIAFDENYLYVADRSNHRIQKFSLDGTFITKWGTFGSGNGQFDNPTGIAIYDNEIYVTDRDNDRIQVFDNDGNFQSVLSISVGTSAGELDRPKDIIFDSSGYLYITDGAGIFNRVQKFETDGTFIDEFLRPGSLTPSDNLGYIVGDNGTYLESTDGGNTYTAVTPPSDIFSGRNLTSISVNKNDPDYILITDENGRIYYTSDGGSSWNFHSLSLNLYNCTFKPTSNTFNNAIIVGSFSSNPRVVRLTSDDGSAYDIEADDIVYPTYIDRAISVSYDNRYWFNDDGATINEIYVVTTNDNWGTASITQKILYYNGVGWELLDIDDKLPVGCSDIYYYNGNIAVSGLNSVVISENDGGSWYVEEMGESEWWQRVFYYGNSYYGYAIGNYYQDSTAQRPLQKSPMKMFSPAYENWPVYKGTTTVGRRYEDVIAKGSIANMVDPNGSNYGYITSDDLYVLHSNSYEELSTASHVVIKQGVGSFYNNRAYKIVDIDRSSDNKIYLDEIKPGFSDSYYGDEFYIINTSDNNKNALIINSPTNNTVVFNQDADTKWYDNVDNEDGWIVEFAMALIDGSGNYTTDTDAYQGIKISDGTSGLTFRVYKNQIELIIEDKIYRFNSGVTSTPKTAGFTNIFTSSLTTDKIYTYTIRGWSNTIEVYIDGIKIEALSGELLTSVNTDKSIEFGDLAGVDYNSAAKWSYIYYKTDKEFVYKTQLLKTFEESTEVKKILHTPYYGYINFQENIFSEDFTNGLWAHNTENTPWVDNVNNDNGWIVEFTTTNNTPSSASFYDRARIYDGTHGMEIRFYHDDNPYVVILIGNNTYSFTSVGDRYNYVFGLLSESDIGNSHTFRVEGEGNRIDFYIDNVIIDELSGDIFNNSTTQKYVDFGNNSGVATSDTATNWGVIKYYLASSSSSVFDVYDNTRYRTYWTYIKETDATTTTTEAGSVNETTLEDWYIITQTDEPVVRLYTNEINDNEYLHTLFNKNILNVNTIKYYTDITSEIGQVNDAIGFYYINGDVDSYKMLFAGRDTEDDDAIVKMLRNGYAFADVILDENYGYPNHYADAYLSPTTIDKSRIVSKIYVVAQGRNQLKSKLYVYNSDVSVLFYKDNDLTEPLDFYDGVPVADFSTETQKVYMKITYYTPKETLPTVYVNQQGSVDETLNTERIDNYTFKAEYEINIQSPDDYLDGFASITVYD
jgi:hypothetical protein